MRKVWLVCGVALATTIVSACQPEVDKEVLIIGDSIAVNGADEITLAFNSVNGPERRYLPALSAIAGIGLTKVNGTTGSDVELYWSTHIASLIAKGNPDTIVVSLGVNDCANTANYDARIDNFMANIPVDIPVFWLTVPDPGRKMTCESVINAALHSALPRWANLTLLPWASFGNAHPELFADNVHHTAEGENEYAHFIKDQLDAR